MRGLVIEVDDHARHQRLVAVERDAHALDRRLPERGHGRHGRRDAREIEIEPLAAGELDVRWREAAVALEDDAQRCRLRGSFALC